MPTTMTRAQYDAIVQAKGAPWADAWRKQNQIQVEGMQPVAYQAYEEPAYDENGELPPVEDQGGALSSVAAQDMAVTPSAAGLPTVQDLYGQQQQLGSDLSAFWTGVQKDRQAQYEQATEELKQRRFGPSRAEQLFQLAAAIGKPTLNRSFGSIMANVNPALASIAEANRTADEERSAAAQALREKYLSDLQGTQLNVLQQRQKNISALTPLAVAQARGAAPKAAPAKVYTDRMGITRHKVTGSPIKQPPYEQINALRAYLMDPNNTPENKRITAQNFDRTYGFGAAEIFGE